VPAQRILASVYFTGLHVTTDSAIGLKWLKRAALQDDAAAQHRLGQKSESIQTLTTTADIKLARTWYQLSAEQEYLESMRAIARSFLKGPSADRNWELAQSWLQLADESGDAEAPYILATYSLRYPSAIEEGTTQPRRLFERAAERGNDRAHNVLALAESETLSLKEASLSVLSTPYEDRYIQNVARKLSALDEQADRQPQVIRIISPIFPPSLRLVETTGEAQIEFIVDTTGRVAEVKVISATHPLFGINAVEAVKQWRFLPGKRKDRLVNTRMNVPVYFNIDDEQLHGVDGVLQSARDYAAQIGGQAEEDCRDLRPAKPIGKILVPKMPNGSPLPRGARAMILLVLDESGVPQRGHVLHAHPAEIGSLLLSNARAIRYEPRQVNHEEVPGSVVLVYGEQ
jgi:TonB family protein